MHRDATLNNITNPRPVAAARGAYNPITDSCFVDFELSLGFVALFHMHHGDKRAASVAPTLRHFSLASADQGDEGLQAIVAGHGGAAEGPLSVKFADVEIKEGVRACHRTVLSG
jgi:hypothetical protein